MFEFWCLLMQLWNQFSLLTFIVRQDQKEVEKICMKKKWGESRTVSCKGGGGEGRGGIVYVKWRDFKIRFFYYFGDKFSKHL